MGIFNLFKRTPRELPPPSTGCKQYNDAEWVLIVANRELYVKQSKGEA